MSAPKRKREVQLNFRVSPEELALIEQKMAQMGTKNREAYLRKMALDGYVVRLELPELKELLARAGFALSHASKFDIIIEYFVSRGQYNVFEINEALFAFDQCLIGA